MYILDTDTLSHLFAGHPRILARRASVPTKEIAITIISHIEVLRGRFDHILKAASGQDLVRAQRWLDQSLISLAEVETVIAIQPAAANEFDRLRSNKKLKKIGRADLLIAAITLAAKATLVTRNVKHFREVPGLPFENWAD